MKVALLVQGSWDHKLLLSQEAQVNVTVYDHGSAKQQGGGLALVSKRRNKAWYRLARLGADFYQNW